MALEARFGIETFTTPALAAVSLIIVDENRNKLHLHSKY